MKEVFVMEAWNARLKNVCITFMENDEDNEVNIAMALDQFESNLYDKSLLWWDFVGDFCKENAKNIDRAKVVMDKQVYLDYFLDELVYGPIFFAFSFV